MMMIVHIIIKMFVHMVFETPDDEHSNISCNTLLMHD